MNKFTKKLNEIRQSGKTFKKNSFVIMGGANNYFKYANCIDFINNPNNYRKSVPNSIVEQYHNEIINSHSNKAYLHNLEYKGSVRWIKKSHQQFKKRHHRQTRQDGRKFISNELNDIELYESI